MHQHRNYRRNSNRNLLSSSFNIIIIIIMFLLLISSSKFGVTSSFQQRQLQLLSHQKLPVLRRPSSSAFLLQQDRCQFGGGGGGTTSSRTSSSSSSSSSSTSSSSSVAAMSSSSSSSSLSSSSSSSAKNPKSQQQPASQKYRAYIAVGSNLGNRYQNIDRALKLLCNSSGSSSSSGCENSNNNNDDDATATTTTKIIKTSFLHETAPMYVTDQPRFLNGAVELETCLEPLDLLNRIKQIESELGRNFSSGIRNGPRPVDLDILLYEIMNDNNDNNSDENFVKKYQPIIVNDPNLTVPHPRIQEREFVLQPLLEVGGARLLHPKLNATVAGMLRKLYKKKEKEEVGDTTTTDDDIKNEDETMVRVLPLPNGRVLHMNGGETLIMGILNVTPDSFSGDGYYAGGSGSGSSSSGGAASNAVNVNAAIQRAMQMQNDGANIIDIGGESTRPGADVVDIDTEIQRTMPVIKGIRERQACDDNDIIQPVLSIDTRNAQVAREAILAGADIVNDVSGGTYDPNMLRTVANLGVPMILMHMKGTPQTMQSMAADYKDIVKDVTDVLVQRSTDAEIAGVHRWLQIIDPGIGFAKDLNGNLELLRNLKSIRKATDNLPILLGTSRKGFIGKLSNVNVAKNRDPGTIASCVAALCLDDTTTTTTNRAAPGATGAACNILRVHNVADNKQAAMVMDAIIKQQQQP